MNLGKITRKEPSDFERMCGFDGKTCHPQFKTEVREVRYDFKRRVGFVYMEPLCCVDMGGATSFFEAIDPNVQMVVTVAGDKLDTSYLKTDRVRQGTSWFALVHVSTDRGSEFHHSPSEVEPDEVRAAMTTLIDVLAEGA